MPSAIACPVCSADGTAAANQIIAQTLASQPPPPVTLAPPPTQLRPAAAPPPAVAPPSTRPTAQDAMRRLSQSAGGTAGSADRWKWWYWIFAGLIIGGYAVYQFTNGVILKSIGDIAFALLCIAIGIWDFNRKRKAKRAQG